MQLQSLWTLFFNLHNYNKIFENTPTKSFFQTALIRPVAVHYNSLRNYKSEITINDYIISVAGASKRNKKNQQKNTMRNTANN